MPELHFSLPNTDEAKTVELTGDEITIGRSDSNVITVVDKAMSRNHAVLRKTEEGYLLVDNGSANGSFVNGAKVIDHALSDGDEIRLGSTVFRFSDPPDPEATVLLNAMEELRKAKIDVERTVTVPEPPPPAAPAARPEAPMPPPPAPQPPTARPQAPPPPVAPRPQAPPPAAAPWPQAPPPVAPPAVAPAPAPVAPAPPRAPIAAPVVPAPAAVPVPQRPSAPAVSARPAVSGAVYAGFWIRLLAYVLDGLLLGLVLSVIQVPATLIATALAQRQPGLAVAIAVLGWLMVTGGGIFYILYFWATRGATPAKHLLKLKIVRADGVEPMGWGKAALRLVGYMASGFILYIGFIMVAFTERNRGLHDMIADTVVIKTG